jgi:hypothetical protein
MSRWAPPVERFWSKVTRSDTCWEWTGCLSDTGYGTFYAGKVYSTHRYAWELTNGPIPSGLCVLHRCDNRACVRPDHLFLGTKADNTRDMVAKGRHVSGKGRRRAARRLSQDVLDFTQEPA